LDALFVAFLDFGVDAHAVADFKDVATGLELPVGDFDYDGFHGRKVF